ncbi:Tyrosine recombinase XerC [subsurface metagenome]
MKTLTLEQEIKLLSAIGPVDETCCLAQHYHEKGIYDSFKWKELRNLLAVLFMLDAGLRVGEVAGLRYPDVYFENQPVKTLCVRKIIAKKHREREIPLTERIIIVLSHYLPFPALIMDHPFGQALIATKPWGHALTTRTLERIVTRGGEAALGFPVNPHMLRHTYATKLMKITDIRTVQELLGHKNVSSTQIYTHVNDEDKRKAVLDLQGLVISSSGNAPGGQLPGQVNK